MNTYRMYVRTGRGHMRVGGTWQSPDLHAALQYAIGLALDEFGRRGWTGRGRTISTTVGYVTLFNSKGNPQRTMTVRDFTRIAEIHETQPRKEER